MDSLLIFIILALKQMTTLSAITSLSTVTYSTLDSKTTVHNEVDRVYYVVPENIVSDVSCQKIECHTLAYYMNFSMGSSPSYFRSNEIYTFWSGIHSPPPENVTVIISDTVNLQFVGNGATINCRGKPVGFHFKRSNNTVLQNLSFLSCMGTLNIIDSSHALLSFVSCFDLFLDRVQILESVHNAIYIKNTFGVVELRKLTITNSKLNAVNKNQSNAGSAAATIIYEMCYDHIPHLVVKNSVFVNNTYIASSASAKKQGVPTAGGLTIVLECESIDVEVHNVTMRNNSGSNGGHFLIVIGRSTCGNITVQNCRFESGYSYEGSGLYLHFTRLRYKIDNKVSYDSDILNIDILDSQFFNNKAVYAGSGISIVQTESQTSNICERRRIKIMLKKCVFVNNSVITPGFGGIALHSVKLNLDVANYVEHVVAQHIIQVKKCEFRQNYIATRGKSSGGTAVLFTKSNAHFQLTNTTILYNNCSAILAVSSNILLSGEVILASNSASSGSGLLLCDDAVMYLEEYTNVTITNNIAEHAGGGITVESKCIQSKPLCFYQLGENVLQSPSLIKTIKVNIFNNSAGFAGDNLFGGFVEYCFLISRSGINDNKNIFKTVFNISNKTVSYVSSPPQQVCLCKNQTHDCNIPDNSTLRNLNVFPGENFTVKAALVGQLNGLVKGAVRTHLIDPNTKQKLDCFINKVQRIDTTTCELLHYTVYSDQPHLILKLGIQQFGDVSGLERLSLFEDLKMNLTLKKCPIGFSLRNNSLTGYHGLHCGCCELFQTQIRFGKHFKFVCDIGTQRIFKPNKNVWIGLTESGSLALHPNCPFNYCNQKSHYVRVINNTFDQDSQCSSRRTGVMCGACQKGYSVTIGLSECQRCSNYWLLLYIFFALLGIALIFFLTLVNWTISDGTFSGIIFYCNIVRSSMMSYFPDGVDVPFLTHLLKVFIAYMNLDSIRATCLYNGMDAYWHTWLRLVLPLYILIVAGTFVCLASRCSCIVKRNAVKVLASIVLLSYARLLYVSITAVHVTQLYTEDGNYELRWSYDGTIKYFSGKHKFLVLAASLVGLLLLPFALCLFCIQCLQRVNHYYLFSWVNRLKPFFDAYTGPFNSRARFWTGLLLLVRVIIYISSTIDKDSYPNLSTGVISLAVLFLLFIVFMLPQNLYRQRSLNILECGLLFNLGFSSTVITFAGMSRHEKRSHLIIAVCTHLSVGITFIIFTAVALYHISKLRLIQMCFQYARSCLVQRCRTWNQNREDESSDSDDEQNPELVSLFDEERQRLM